MPHPLFNSLGSNYSARYVRLALKQLIWPDRSAPDRLTALLNERWPGKVQLVYKGRDAIEYALRVLKIGKGQAVITQAFSCHAIEEAIARTGATPIYADLDPVRLNPSPKTLEAAWRKSPSIQAVIIQHTLGLPADIKRIRTWCDQHDVWLIEDLAQAAGGSDTTGTPLGSVADVVVLSFGRDKVIDGVAGGAVILRHPDLELLSRQLPQPPRLAVMQDLTYPVLTSLIRTWFSSGVGKIIWKVGRMTGWLRSPVASPTHHMTRLPASLAALAADQLAELAASLEHRRQIAQTYLHVWHKSPLVPPVYALTGIVAGATHQRFLINTTEPTQVIHQAAAANIYISDRWYRQPVDSGSLNRATVYLVGSCPVAENLAHHCSNVPTHRGISATAAKRIAEALYV